MLRPSSTEWPIWHDDPWQNPQPGEGLVSLRHDIALARYLEMQRGWRASTIPSFDLWAITTGSCVLIARVGRAFFRRVGPSGASGRAVGRVQGGAL